MTGNRKSFNFYSFKKETELVNRDSAPNSVVLSVCSAFQVVRLSWITRVTLSVKYYRASFISVMQEESNGAKRFLLEVH